MNYHLYGSISAFFMLLCSLGLVSQIVNIWQRKKENIVSSSTSSLERPTAVLSTSRFFSSYITIYATYLYGISTPRFNHYLAWPRFVALILVLIILTEIFIDRKEKEAKIILNISFCLLAFSALPTLFNIREFYYNLGISQTVMILTTTYYIFSAIGQLKLIRQSGSTGVLSKKMHQLFFLKDLSTITFGLVMGIEEGWPLMLIGTCSLTVQIATLWQFHWAKTSEVVL